jgi:putative transposase
MVRPLRIEYAGAVYHVTSRGDRREPIAKDDTDRALFLDVVGQALERFDAQAWAYCLMGNHYHPRSEFVTPDASDQRRVYPKL